MQAFENKIFRLYGSSEHSKECEIFNKDLENKTRTDYPFVFIIQNVIVLSS